MSTALEKCIKFENFNNINDIELVESNLRETIHQNFIEFGENVYKETEINYPFHLYSFLYNVNKLVYGDNRYFDWNFLNQQSKAGHLESKDLETSKALVSAAIFSFKSTIPQFPVNYQVHPFQEYKCPKTLKQCYSPENNQYSNYIIAYPAMEELLHGTYGLSAVMRNDFAELEKHECFIEQIKWLH